MIDTSCDSDATPHSIHTGGAALRKRKPFVSSLCRAGSKNQQHPRYVELRSFRQVAVLIVVVNSMAKKRTFAQHSGETVCSSVRLDYGYSDRFRA